MQDQPNGRKHERSDGDQRKVVFGKELTGDFDGAAQPGRARGKDFVGPPNRLHQILNNEDDREGGDNLEQSGGSIIRRSTSTSITIPTRPTTMAAPTMPTQNPSGSAGRREVNEVAT